MFQGQTEMSSESSVVVYCYSWLLQDGCRRDNNTGNVAGNMKTDDPLPTARGEGEEGRESAFCKGENRVQSISFNFGKCTGPQDYLR